MRSQYEQDWRRDDAPNPAEPEPDAIDFEVHDADVDRQVSDLETMVRIAASLGRDREHGRMLKVAASVGQRIGSQYNAQGQSRAFYAWNQGRSRVEGPTIHLIEALAAEWGCISTDIKLAAIHGTDVELSIAVADLVNLTFDRRPFVFTVQPPPAKFAKKPEQAQRWRTMQMQSGISKAKRTALEHVLPEWYRTAALDEAKRVASADILTRTNPQTGEVVKISLRDAIQDALDYYRNRWSVSREQLEAWIEDDVTKWTVSDCLRLRGLAQDLRDGTVNPDAVFTTVTVQPEPAAQPAPQGGLAALGHQPAETVEDGHAVEVESAATAPPEAVETTTPPPAAEAASPGDMSEPPGELPLGNGGMP